MAKILCITSDIAGILYPGTELARRLKVAGHHMTFSGPPQARPLAELHGLDFLPLPASRLPEFLASDSTRGFLTRLRCLTRRRCQALAALEVTGLRQEVERISPDLVLIDGEMHEHILVVAGCGIPIALLNSFVSIWRRPGLPPPHRRARPGVGITGSRLGMWFLWKTLHLEKQRRAVVQAVSHVGCDRLSLLRQLAHGSGLDLRRETDSSQWLIPFTYRRLPVLSLHAREFELPHQPPRRVHYVGPMVLEERGDSLPEDVLPELEEIYNRRRNGSTSALIYAGFGSFFTSDINFLHRLLAAVAERDDWEIVISLGRKIDPASLAPLPPRAHVFSWLPQLEILRHTDVAVTHGGINTLDECVLAGVPVLVYCGYETDMAGNTSRVEYHRLGIAGDRRRDTPQTIRQHLERLLDEPSFSDNVGSLQVSYRKYAEEHIAERAVNELLQGSTPGPLHDL